MQQIAIKIGLLLACLPTTILTLWAIVATLRSFPADGTPAWFMQGVLALGLLFALVSGWHGVGAGLAVRTSGAFSEHLSQGLRLFVVALTAACGSMVASFAACLLLVLLPTSMKGFERIALGSSITYATFFGVGFAYRFRHVSATYGRELDT